MLIFNVVTFLLLALFLLPSAAFAEIPDSIKNILKKDHPQIKFRIDDLAYTRKNLWLLIKPNKKMELLEPESVTEKKEPSEIKLILKTDKDDYLFSNGWIYTPIENNTIKSYDYYPKIFQDILIQSTIHQGFLVPKDFHLPRDLAMLAGRLALKLSAVELATDRELLYRERLKEENKTHDFEFLTYTVENGIFNLIKINQKEDQISKIEINQKEDISKKIYYASKIKKIEGQIYISDQISGKIFLLKRTLEKEFDAANPLENNKKKEEKIERYQLETYVDISDYTKNMGIKDFEMNKAGSNIYILSSIDSKLHIIDPNKKIIIKSIQLPASVDGMKLISRSLREPDKLIFRSRSGAKIFIVNTFDYRISTILDLNKMNDTYRFIPHDLLVSSNYILVATEALYKSLKMPKDPMGKILALDPITGKLVSVIDMKFIPYSLSFSKDKESFFAIGSDLNSKTIVGKFDSKKLKLLSSADLSPDIIDSKNISVSSSGNFMLVPSPASNQIGVIDLKSCTLVKKLDIGMPTNILLAL